MTVQGRAERRAPYHHSESSFSSSGESLLNRDLIKGNSLFLSQEKPSDAADVLVSFSDVVLLFPGLCYFSKI